jgi:hypothetical protein
MISSSSAGTGIHPSIHNELDFHPQLWLTANTSGALVNVADDDPVALAHDMLKYAEMYPRGSR